MDFGKLLNEWERLSARPGGLDRASAAENRARAADAADRAARDRAAKADRDREARRISEAGRSLESWLAANPVPDKDAALDRSEDVQGDRSHGHDGHGRASDRSHGGQLDREAETTRLRDLRPQATIDLHGMSAAEAETALEAFLETHARRGIEKVLIVTGKGNHSAGEPVLGKAARRVLERSQRAGRFGEADGASGGRGALWALLRPPTSRGR